jgi:hypothetical protein
LNDPFIPLDWSLPGRDSPDPFGNLRTDGTGPLDDPAGRDAGGGVIGPLDDPAGRDAGGGVIGPLDDPAGGMRVAALSDHLMIQLRGAGVMAMTHLIIQLHVIA